MVEVGTLKNFEQAMANITSASLGLTVMGGTFLQRTPSRMFVALGLSLSVLGGAVSIVVLFFFFGSRSGQVQFSHVETVHEYGDVKNRVVLRGASYDLKSNDVATRVSESAVASSDMQSTQHTQTCNTPQHLLGKMKCRYWKWLSEEECISGGLLIGGQSQPGLFQDYSRVKIAATNREGLLVFLAGHGISMEEDDSSDGDADDNKTLDELVWRLVASDSYFMTPAVAGTSSEEVLLMRNVVRIYLSDADRVLIQSNRGSSLPDALQIELGGALSRNTSGSLASNRGLSSPTALKISEQGGFLFPFVDRHQSETTVAAAQRFWTLTLKMPLELASFLEDEAMYEDTDPLMGVRVVLHVHRVFIQIADRNDVAVFGIGLAEHTPFMPDDGARVQFSWVTSSECLELGLESCEVEDAFLYPRPWTIESIRRACLPDTQDGASSTETPHPDGSSASDAAKSNSYEQRLAEWLTQVGIDTAKWNESKTVGDLYRELEDGSCTLVHDARMGVQRVVTIVVLRIKNPGNTTFLVEVGSCGGDDEIKWDACMPAGKVKSGELPSDAARRILWSYLQIEDDDFDWISEEEHVHSNHRKGEAYQGLPTRYIKIFFDVTLSDDEGC
jgi:hypothetical protein